MLLGYVRVMQAVVLRNRFPVFSFASCRHEVYGRLSPCIFTRVVQAVVLRNRFPLFSGSWEP